MVEKLDCRVGCWFAFARMMQTSTGIIMMVKTGSVHDAIYYWFLCTLIAIPNFVIIVLTSSFFDYYSGVVRSSRDTITKEWNRLAFKTREEFILRTTCGMSVITYVRRIYCSNNVRTNTPLSILVKCPHENAM